MDNPVSINQLGISFETLSVPPPYSHTYSFSIKLAPNGINLQYQLAYTHRDELSEEEIWEEGFSGQDDFSWAGSLPSVWRDALLAVWKSTQLVSEEKYAKPAENGLLLTAELTNGQQVTGVPEEIASWEYFLQELTQAVYEAAQRERPLRIRYLKRSAQEEELQLIITVHFLKRSLEIIRQQGKQQGARTLSWAEAKPLLSTLYQLDYATEGGHSKMPNRSGEYLDPGDGQWYQLGKETINPGKIDFVEKLRQKLEYFDKSFSRQ